MSEIHETIEKAQEGEQVEGFNKRIALVIAVLALFLSFSETLGKSAQTEAIDAKSTMAQTGRIHEIATNEIPRDASGRPGTLDQPKNQLIAAAVRT